MGRLSTKLITEGRSGYIVSKYPESRPSISSYQDAQDGQVEVSPVVRLVTVTPLLRLIALLHSVLQQLL